MKCVLFLLLTFLCFGLGQEDAAASVEPVNFSKMRVKQLKKFLKDRGLECKGCAEKNDFVLMATEHEETPLVEVKKPSTAQPRGDSDSFGGDTNIDDLMASMRKMGMNGNVFTKEDMEKMNKDGKGYEDMFKGGGGGGQGGYKPPKRSKKSKSDDARRNEKAEEEAKEQGSETIEL